MIQELVIAKIGEAVAKAILKMWLGESGIIGTLAGSTVEIISSIGIDIASKRKLQREFHQIADRIADNVLPLFEMEGARLPENDIKAVVLTLGEAIDRTDVTPLTLVKNYDLRSSELTKEILYNAESQKKYFSADANALLDRVAAETSGYIIEISTRLPTFSPAIFSELLQRQKQLDDVVVEVLNEIRRLSETTRALNPKEEAGKFERRYRTAIAHRNDEVELFGLDAPSKIRRQNLKVAYVTLSMQRRLPKRQKAEAARLGELTIGKLKLDDLGASVSGGIAVHSRFATENLWRAAVGFVGRAFRSRALFNSEACDAILATAPRLLIRGEAGSGKTTLLQWIAVSAASQRLDGSLKSWNEGVPLMVQLRQYAEKSLPSPNELVTNAIPEIADGLPTNWVENLLEAGRAIILLDGIDELDALKREEVRGWVRGLIGSYPNCRYILTSRMAAVEEDWLAGEKFDEAELLPMGWPDIDNLIDHWHNALAIQQSVPESVDDLTVIAAQLKKQLRQNRRLADLATSPLLCAMLCALHYERRQQLPPNRIALYDSAIRMLLDQRDRARGIGKLKLPDLTEEQKRAFLERLAYWMLRNNSAATTIGDATSEVARTKPIVQNLPSDATPVRVLELLIQRSGIIRSPAQGYVDFVHKTFQEFLGAKAIVDSNDLQFLVSKAHEDQWHETVVLAAGIAPQIQRDEFLRSLVARGEKERIHRHKLYLLAVACLETAVKLSPDVEKLLDEHIRAVIPPRNMTEARSLKAAGALAVPLLRRKHTYSAREAAATVRALSMIGSDDALTMLESYGEDSRLTVIRELVAGWDAFDSETYARRVLVNSPLEYSRLYQTKNSHLGSLHYLKDLRGLYLFSPISIDELSKIGKVKQLSMLYIDKMKDITSIESLITLNNLTELHLNDASKLASLAPINDMSNLRHLTIMGLSQTKELFRPGDLGKLTQLYCGGTPESRWRAEDQFTESLNIYYATWPIEDLRLLANCHDISFLACQFGENTKNIELIGTFRSLSNLQIKFAGAVDISWLSELKKLKSLELENIGVTDLAAVYDNNTINELSLSGAEFVDVSRAVFNKPIAGLDLDDTKIDSVFPNLKNAEHLRRLVLRNVRGLSDLSAILEIPKLAALFISGCPDVRNLESIREKIASRRIRYSLEM